VRGHLRIKDFRSLGNFGSQGYTLLRGASTRYLLPATSLTAPHPPACSTTTTAYPPASAQAVAHTVAVFVYDIVTHTVAIFVDEAASTTRPFAGAQAIAHTVAVFVHEAIADAIAVFVYEASPLAGQPVGFRALSQHDAKRRHCQQRYKNSNTNPGPEPPVFDHPKTSLFVSYWLCFTILTIPTNFEEIMKKICANCEVSQGEVSQGK
jgi:hypothetical protein